MIRDVLCELGYEDVLLFDSPDYDSAVVGVTTDGRAVYEYDLMIRDMVERNGCSYEEAMEFIDYNSVRAAEYQADGPIVFYRVAAE